MKQNFNHRQNGTLKGESWDQKIKKKFINEFGAETPPILIHIKMNIIASKISKI